MIQALAGKFSRNLCYLSPTHPELSDDSLKSAIERVPDNAIVVLEDVDALFGKNREKKIHQSPLTFSGLLNALDGVGNHEGLIFVLTTNFKEQLDAALIRDGRVDYRLRFDYCTPEQMEKMFENFYPQCKKQTDENNEAHTDASENPEIAALEAKLAALKKATAACATCASPPTRGALGAMVDSTLTSTKEERDSDDQPTGAAFRDALLKSLRDRVVSASQLQHFFVMHRKFSPAEAINDVGSIAAAIDERTKEEERAAKKTGEKEEEEKPERAGGEKLKDKEGARGQASGGATTVHVHVHTAE